MDHNISLGCSPLAMRTLAKALQKSAKAEGPPEAFRLNAGAKRALKLADQEEQRLAARQPSNENKTPPPSKRP